MFRDSRITLSNEQIFSYHENGFVQIDAVLKHNEVEELRGYMDEVMKSKSERSVQTSEQKKAYYKVLNQRVNIWRDHGGMARFVLSGRFAGMAEQLIGNGVRLFHDHALLKMPYDSKETSWHQDYPYWPMQESGAPSIWLTLDDVDEQNGCMQFIPQTQTQQLNKLKAVSLVGAHDILEEAEKAGTVLDKTEAVTVPMKEGSCTFHDGLTFHAAFANQTAKPRRVLAIIYMPDGTVYNGESHITVADLQLKAGDELAGGRFPRLV